MQETLTNHDGLRNQVPTMPFGAHKGKRLDELSHDYLIWLSHLNDLRQPLLGRLLREMARRLGASEAQP